MTDTNADAPARRTWRKKQPTAARMRETIAAGERRIKLLEREVAWLREPSWWVRLFRGPWDPDRLPPPGPPYRNPTEPPPIRGRAGKFGFQPIDSPEGVAAVPPGVE